VLQGNTCQNSLLSGEGRSLAAKISGEGVVPGEYFWFLQTRHILLSDSTICTVLCAVVLTQYRRVTDGRTDRRTDRQTDGNAIASKALAMRALWRAVKTQLGIERVQACRASTSMYSLTFRVCVATPTQYGRNGTASLQITSHTQQARRFYRWCVRACVVRAACGVRRAWRITAGLCHAFP